MPQMPLAGLRVVRCLSMQEWRLHQRVQRKRTQEMGKTQHKKMKVQGGARESNLEAKPAKPRVSRGDQTGLYQHVQDNKQ